MQAFRQRKRLQYGNGLVFAENEPTRTMNFADHVDHFRLRNRNDVVWKNLNILFGSLCVHDFSKVHLSYAELARRIELRAGQGDATPLQLPGDSNAVPGVLADPAGHRQHLHHSLVPLHLVDTRRIHSTQHRDWLAAHLRDFDDNLWVPNVLAQNFVHLLLGLLDGQTSYFERSGQRARVINLAITEIRLVDVVGHYWGGNVRLVARFHLEGSAH